MPRRYRIFVLVAAAAIFLDQATKAIARHGLIPGRRGRTAVIAGWFDLELRFNTGGAFSLFQNVGGTRLWLTVIALAACVALVVVLRRSRDAGALLAAGLALLFAGALGNAIDRVTAGQVTDFVVWKVGRHEWPAFNVADAALVVGVLGLLLLGGPRRARPEP